jgi:hypothetical protein
MDDLKLIGRREEELRNEIRTVKKISDDTNMSLDWGNLPEFHQKVARFIEINTQATQWRIKLKN